MKDTLYNLALDFERKRQYNKAVAIYEHISNKDPEFKDVKSKIDVLKKAADGAVFGTSLGKGREATVIMEGSTMAPTLGRYEIQKELGKGAMGIVYLGKDPKINRTVAIKTTRFEDDIDEKTLKEVKIRFFREAQAAGNLSHPNILKIFDAGEEQEMAYIAMELLKGDDLKKWTTKGSLLPLEKTLEYMQKSAEALDYAHKGGVIHRDIKPANIMLLDDGTVRVADFGIARIQESSKTATGTVMGTPYYMSPEQIAGKKVDGRADIFSLGVTMFELLTGERPWKGGDAVGTLFFQITADPYPDPMICNPALTKDMVAIIDKALKKNPDERYQTAGQMAEDIKNILHKTPRSAEGPKAPADSAKPSTLAPEQKKPAVVPAQQAKPVPMKAAAGASAARIDAASAPATTPQPPGAVVKPMAPPLSKPTAGIPAASQASITDPQLKKPAPAQAIKPLTSAPAPVPPMPAVQAAKPQIQPSPALELAPREGLEMTMKIKTVADSPGETAGIGKGIGEASGIMSTLVKPKPAVGEQTGVPTPSALGLEAPVSGSAGQSADGKQTGGGITANATPPELLTKPDAAKPSEPVQAPVPKPKAPDNAGAPATPAGLVLPAGGGDFEKTLPLIYPEEENK